MIDLHTHTTASDGTFTPAELVRRAKAIGLTAVAITDHDTLDGLPEALSEGERQGITVVPGTEISLDYKGPRLESGRSGWMHLLVYWVDGLADPRNQEPGTRNQERAEGANLAYSEGALAVELRELQRWRAERNQRIIAKLNQLGLELTLDEVVAASGGGQVGRPHFARVLLDKGYVKHRQEAFDRYLTKGAPAYEDKRRLGVEDAISRARAEGAVPVLAHPFSLGLNDEDLRARLAAWKRSGLCGIETIYPEHSNEFRARLNGMARTLDLIATGGTDFHGANKPGQELGRGRDRNVRVEDRVLEDLFAMRKHS